MRESIGGAWIFGLVTIFILLFSAFLAITINYSKAFKIKNGIIDIIEQEEGYTNGDTGSIGKIETYLDGTGYYNKGKCSGGGWLSGNETTINGKKEYRYCIKKHNVYSSKNPQKAYYEVRVFFNLDLPIFGDFFTFRVTGETTDIFYPADCNMWGEC